MYLYILLYWLNCNVFIYPCCKTNCGSCIYISCCIGYIVMYLFILLYFYILVSTMYVFIYPVVFLYCSVHPVCIYISMLYWLYCNVQSKQENKYAYKQLDKYHNMKSISRMPRTETWNLFLECRVQKQLLVKLF